MKIGLLGGSFNPVHVGHMMVANYMAQFAGLDEVWMMLSPQNPLKDSTTLIDDRHRLKMLEIAVGADRQSRIKLATWNSHFHVRHIPSTHCAISTALSIRRSPSASSPEATTGSVSADGVRVSPYYRTTV